MRFRFRPYGSGLCWDMWRWYDSLRWRGMLVGDDAAPRIIWRIYYFANPREK